MDLNDPARWEQHADWWQREFTNGADPEYEEQILPLIDRHLAGARRVLDIGCGEGQVSRRAVALGAEVVGVDPTNAQITVAQERGGGPAYVRAVADDLPCRSGAFDAVVMCLVIEHIDPIEPCIHEIARVLAPRGRFLLLLNHPLLQTPGSGWIDDQILEEQYWRVGPYIHDDKTLEQVAPGIDLPFMHRPLGRYVHVMGEVGLLIDDMDEPPPPPGFLAAAQEYRERGRNPAADVDPRPSRGVNTAALEAPPVDLDRDLATSLAPETQRGSRRALAACALLFVVYLALSFANDPRGTLGTDTGGKLATSSTMEHTGGLIPEVGYWAAPFDPRGELHPLYYTSQVGEHWVNVTTLPMVYIGMPLYDLAGERGLLIVPMIGGVLCALAARRLARLLGNGDGWMVFWVVGLATPVTVYALDFWEHTLGLAGMLFGIGAFVEIARPHARFRTAFLAGLLFGAAATMRTEALVYLATATAIVLAFRLVRRDHLRRVVGLGAAIGTGGTLVLVANQILERAVFGSSLRAGRAAGTAGAAGSGLTGRIGEAFVTTFGLNGLKPPVDVMAGIGIVALVGVGVFLLGFAMPRQPLPGVAAFVVAGIVLVARFGDGLGFVPGMLVASPLAAVGLMYGWRERRSWLPIAIAGASLPLVWLFQYQGGARPQWGGRYVLLSGVLLAVVGVRVLRRRRPALVATVVLSLLVTASGVVWLSERSHAVADGMETLLARHDQAIVSTDAHLFREGGAFYTPDRHWLTALTDEDLLRAARVVAQAGDTEVAVVGSVDHALPRRLGDFARGPSQRLEVLPGTPLRVVTYVRS